MKTIAILALLVLTAAVQAKTKSPLLGHNANNIIGLLQQTVQTGGLGEIRHAIKVASDYSFESEQFFTPFLRRIMITLPAWVLAYGWASP